VAHFLAEISVLYTERHVSAAQPLTLHVGRHEIADYLGLTIETVSRSIGKLKGRGIIAIVESGEIVILDFKRLRETGKVSR
jgi:CRP/FNR family transcriptional regulator